ncbi:putative transcriptional regulator [Evansella vedderi]|uniref:Transcriptional regulator n=1 Tax=Evansella vedderi TaxID=38282 RepID=A0ABU0A5F3_9BACI|nr:helix-turn-helix transcriptional regulator [Evansella vedderi]MDQ0257933.1 putative transcriptional regulator [Evansella vedderi]
MFGLGLGLGKKRSRLGRFLDRHGKTQEWLVRKAGLGRSTVADLVSGDCEREPTTRTVKKILKALRELDPSVKADDFWDM